MTNDEATQEEKKTPEGRRQYDWELLVLWALHTIGGVGTALEILDRVGLVFDTTQAPHPGPFGYRVEDVLRHSPAIEEIETEDCTLFRFADWPHPDGFLLQRR